MRRRKGRKLERAKKEETLVPRMSVSKEIRERETKHTNDIKGTFVSGIKEICTKM